MASCEPFHEESYEIERFQGEVNANLCCIICLCVLRDPVMCQRNEHSFCRPCITRHLGNDERCPTCMEELSLETLKPASRIMKEWLSQLMIHCDYEQRGCAEVVMLEDLARHVHSCGFAPVLCENKGCMLVINRCEKHNHEHETCELRETKCHDCAKLREDVTTMAQKLKSLEIGFVSLHGDMKANQTSLREEMKVMMASQTAMQNLIQLTNTSQAAMNCKMQAALTQINEQLSILPTQHGNQMSRKTPTESSSQNAPRSTHSILVMGGTGHDGQKFATVETLDQYGKQWVPCSALKTARSSTAACVTKFQQVFITGGVTETGATDSVETCRGHQNSSWDATWVKLPVRLYGHGCVAYNETLIISGGRDEKDVTSEKIFGMNYKSSLTRGVLGRLPFARYFHISVLYNDTVLICGGRTGDLPSTSIASVVQFDIGRGLCRELPPLPFAVSRMAAVESNGHLFIMGGVDKDGNRLKSVVMYNPRTGRSEMRPEMRCARNGCTAVVARGGIFVIGGRGENGNDLKSVERFDLGCSVWEDMPDLRVARFGATAVIQTM